MELDESIFQVDVLKLLENAGWNPSFYSMLRECWEGGLNIWARKMTIDKTKTSQTNED